MNKITVKQGDNLFNQEDVAESMFVCIEGLLSTEVDGIEVGQTKAYSIRAGQHFGEGALLGGQWREYSVTAETDSLVYEIMRRDFDPIIGRHKEIEKYLEQTHNDSTERAKAAVENASSIAKEEPKKKKRTAMNKVMNLWPKKKPAKQTFLTECKSKKTQKTIMILNRPTLIKLKITISIAWLYLFFNAHSQESPINQFEINSNFATPWLEEAISELSSIPNAAKDEIESHRVALSYIDPTRAIQLLSLHGYTIGKPEDAVDPKTLPLIVPLPGTTFHDLIPKAEEKFPQTETDPINELVIFHNPSNPLSTKSNPR